MNVAQVTAALTGIGPAVYPGYAATGAVVPYLVHRPLTVLGEDLAITGDQLTRDDQWSIYCCGASVEASFNLAKATLLHVAGTRINGSVVTASIGYVGAPVEGHYETQVTIQAYEGGL